jgi:hypothetical protein
MNKHHGRHGDSSHFAQIFMHGYSKHHAGGGPAMGVAGNMPSNTSRYRKGGKAHHRSHHAEGGGANPITGTSSPDIVAKRKGGRACHAEGDIVATPYRHGGKPHHKHHHHRKHHAEGDGIRSFTAKTPLMRHGGHRKRSHHDDGDQVEMMSHGGRKKKIGREHHDFGDTVGNILSGIAQSAPMWLPMLLSEGGSASTNKLAAGGAGKVRKGMLSKSGKIIKNY